MAQDLADWRGSNDLWQRLVVLVEQTGNRLGLGVAPISEIPIDLVFGKRQEAGDALAAPPLAVGHWLIPGAHAAIGDDSRVDRIPIAENPCTHGRVEPVGTDNEVGMDLVAIGKSHHALRKALDLGAEHQAIAPKTVDECLMQRSAVETDQRLAVALDDHGRVEIGERRTIGAT